MFDTYASTLPTMARSTFELEEWQTEPLHHARRLFFSTKTPWNFVTLLPYRCRCVGSFFL